MPPGVDHTQDGFLRSEPLSESLIGQFSRWARSALYHLSCYQRRPELSGGERRDLFLRVLERARQKYRFVVTGYVVMPEHFHLLITEPEVGDPSVVMKVVKARFTKLLRHGGVRPGPIWQKRFYDFNVCSMEKRLEKLRYMHRNPVKRGLVTTPEEWKWSSFRT